METMSMSVRQLREVLMAHHDEDEVFFVTSHGEYLAISSGASLFGCKELGGRSALVLSDVPEEWLVESLAPRRRS